MYYLSSAFVDIIEWCSSFRENTYSHFRIYRRLSSSTGLNVPPHVLLILKVSLLLKIIQR